MSRNESGRGAGTGSRRRLGRRKFLSPQVIYNGHMPAFIGELRTVNGVVACIAAALFVIDEDDW